MIAARMAMMIPPERAALITTWPARSPAITATPMTTFPTCTDMANRLPTAPRKTAEAASVMPSTPASAQYATAAWMLAAVSDAGTTPPGVNR